MRISDWSSDVCSSDLIEGGEDQARDNRINQRGPDEQAGPAMPGGNPLAESEIGAGADREIDDRQRQAVIAEGEQAKRQAHIAGVSEYQRRQERAERPAC